MRSDDSDEYQTPSKGMTSRHYELKKFFLVNHCLRVERSRDRFIIVTLLNPPSREEGNSVTLNGHKDFSILLMSLRLNVFLDFRTYVTKNLFFPL